VNGRLRSSAKTRKGKVLAQLKPEEGAAVLHALLKRHPELVAEAEKLAVAAPAGRPFVMPACPVSG
jgi:hypothetical protein